MLAPALCALLSLSTALQTAGPPTCTEWRECRQLALAAADRGDYETFHDLAWRTVQTGPPRDPALMLLLARAQALSGRPHDALVMLDRLAQMGIATDAATNDDFSRTRQLPGWPEVAARMPGRPPSPAPAPAAIAPASPDPAVRPSEPVPGPRPSPPAVPRDPVTATSVSEALRFSTGAFAVGGLAYDAVSGRFLFGDRSARKLIVVSEGSSRPLDLVRGDSAGFHDITAVEVDPRRGDLWVASSAAADGSGALHKLQTVSGRPLKVYAIAAGGETVTLADLAITGSGTVLALDAANRRVLALRPGEGAIKPLVRLAAENATSITTAREEALAYVAHRDGILRIDLLARTASRVTAPRGVALSHIERIRWHRNSLIALAMDEDGSRRIVRLDLNASGRAVTKVTTLQAGLPGAAPTFITISGDDLLYVQPATHAESPSGSASGSVELVTYRLPLR